MLQWGIVVARGASRGGIWGSPPPPQFVGSANYKKFKEIVKLMGKKRLALKFSQEIRTEMRISHFNLEGGLVGKIYVWGDVGGDIWRGYVPHYIPEGGYVLHCIR